MTREGELLQELTIAAATLVCNPRCTSARRAARRVVEKVNAYTAEQREMRNLAAKAAAADAARRDDPNYRADLDG